jgi:hypothetical protein
MGSLIIDIFMDKYIKDNFNGSIDDLLSHCSNLDVDKVEEQVQSEEREECIKVIMRELECNEFEAEVIYNEISLAETKKVVDDMVKDGILYISGYNEDGEPLFQLTELGKALRKEIDNGK